MVPQLRFRIGDLFRELLNQLQKKKWIVYAKPPFGGPAHVLRYLGRYTHRIAISNHRLLAFDGERVSFRWKDYAHGGKQRIMTLEATEFLRRFFLHVLPKGFVRIRHFGLLSNRFRSHCLLLARKLLAARGPRSAATAGANNPAERSALALSQLRRSHGCGAKIDRRGVIPRARSRLLMRLWLKSRTADLLSARLRMRVFSTPYPAISSILPIHL